MLIEEPRSLYVVDLRKEPDPSRKNSIPQSVRFDDIKDGIDGMYKGRTMVVYSQNGRDQLSGRLFRYKGRIRHLAGGYGAWKSEIMGNPEDTYKAFWLQRTVRAEKWSRRSTPPLPGQSRGAGCATSKPGVVVGTPKKRGGCS